jgi:hypothetical protein
MFVKGFCDNRESLRFAPAFLSGIDFSEES